MTQVAASFALRRNESAAVLPLATRAPGVFYIGIDITADSLLSTVYVKSMGGGASLLVEYFEITTSDIDDEQNLQVMSHPAIIAAPAKDKRTFFQLHNKVILRATLTGGAAQFGVYVTLPDAKTDRIWIGDPSPDQRISPDDDDFKFAGETDPGDELVMMDFVADQRLDLRRLNVACSAYGIFTILVNGVIIGSGRTGGAHSNASFEWNASFAVVKDDHVQVTFEQTQGSATPIEAYLMGIKP